MRVFVVVELGPIANRAARISQAFEAVTMDALLFQ